MFAGQFEESRAGTFVSRGVHLTVSAVASGLRTDLKKPMANLWCSRAMARSLNTELHMLKRKLEV
jgi:hypothetical protein